MCTVTFIPTPTGIFITSNRDESPGRQAHGLRSFHGPGAETIHYPLDPSSGGSWIALSDSGRAVCLLNGGNEPFIPAPPYRMSRGEVVRSAVLSSDPDRFFSTFELNGIAPFTLLLYDMGVLNELVWDGHTRHLSSRPVDLPQIWSSVTLYPEAVRIWRKDLFHQWLRDEVIPDRESILTFHQMANGDPENDFIMNRQDKVKTLSVTSILLGIQRDSILHLDLERQTREEIMVPHVF